MVLTPTHPQPLSAQHVSIWLTHCQQKSVFVLPPAPLGAIMSYLNGPILNFLTFNIESYDFIMHPPVGATLGEHLSFSALLRTTYVRLILYR